MSRSASAPPLLEWRGVRKAFGAASVLEGFDLTVRAGEALAILGGSGSGKSVALRHAIRLVRPDAGSMHVDGRDLAGLGDAELLEVRRRVAMVFQGGALFDSMSVGENVAFGIREREPGLPPEELARRAEAALALVQLPGISAMAPSSLSGGMKKRVALARALAVRPEAVLYDEPTTGLDPVTTAHVNRMIRDLHERLAVTSIVVTHDVASALFVADRIVYLRRGGIAFDGTAEEARERPSRELAAFMRGEESG